MTHVDNPLNRRLGRVGKPHGTHVLHKDGTVTIADPYTGKIMISHGIPTSNQLPVATASQDVSQSSSWSLTGLGAIASSFGSSIIKVVKEAIDGGDTGYHTSPVLNSDKNLKADRGALEQHKYLDPASNGHLSLQPPNTAGKPIGTNAPHSDGTGSNRSGNNRGIDRGEDPTKKQHGLIGRVERPPPPPTPFFSTPTTGGYVDNPMNRRLGRVGKPIGTHVVHTDGTITIFDPTKDEVPTRIYADTPFNCKLGRVGKPVTNVDNPMNRRIGRVGQPYDHGFHRLFHRPTDNESPKEKERVEKQEPAEAEKQEPADAKKQEFLFATREVPSSDSTEYKKSDRASRVVQSKEKVPSADNEIHLQVVSFGNDVTHSPRRSIQLSSEVHQKGSNTCSGLLNGHLTTFKKFNVSPTLTKSEQWITKVKREVKFLYGLDHPSVATIYGMVLDIGNVGIVMEHFPRSLFQAVFVEKQDFQESQKITLMRQISDGVEFLHSNGVVLCNLSSASIHLNDRNCAKIESFGPKTLKCENDHLLDHIDERYAAPEIIRHRIITDKQLKKADIYSLAMVVYEIFENEVAYTSLPTEIEIWSAAGSLKIPSSILSILTNCWDNNPDNRPEAAAFSQLE